MGIKQRMNWKQIDAKIKVRAFGISICLLFLCGILFSYAAIGKTNIQITNLGEKSDYATGDIVYVDYIAVNDVKLDSTLVNGEYSSANESKYSFVMEATESVSISVPWFSRVVIAFTRGENRGYVELKGLKSTRVLNLVGNAGEIVKCHPAVTPIYMWGILIVAVVFAFGLFYISILKSIMSSEKVVRNIRKKDFFWILLSGIVSRIYYWRYFPNIYVVSPDTYSYELFFKNGYTDIRTPVYPILYRIAEFFSPEQTKIYQIVVLLQVILGCMAIWVFWCIVNDIVSKRWAVLFTVIYANLPMLIYYEHFLMSDSLSVLLMIWCIRLVQNYLKCPRKKNALWIAIAVTINIMERPGSVFLLPLLLVFFVLYSLENKKNYFSAVYMVIPLIAVIGYCFINYVKVGKFEISCVPVLYNGGYEVTIENFYDGTEYPEIEDRVTYYKMFYGNNQWNYMKYLVEEYGSDYTEFIKNAKSVNRKELLACGADKIIGNLATGIVQNNLSTNREYASNAIRAEVVDTGLAVELLANNILCPFTYGIVYLIIAVTLMMSLYDWLVHKQVNWLQIGLSGILLCTAFIAIWNSYNDYQRLTITIIPSLYILFALWIQQIHEKYIVSNYNLSSDDAEKSQV